MSVGAVQYHFATKDDLLYAAYERVIDQVALRAQRDQRDRARSTTPASCCMSCCRSTSAATAELRVAMAFSARSIHSARLAALYTHGYGALIDAIAGALAQANPALDARQEATQAVALADGLAWQMQCAPDAPRRRGRRSPRWTPISPAWRLDYPAAQWQTVSPSPRSRRIRSRTRTRWGRSPLRSRASSPRAGTACCCSRPSRSPALVRESRKLIRAAREHAGRAVRSRRRRPRARRRRAAVRRAAARGSNPAPPIDIARTIEEVLMRRAAGLRARARAVGAERRQRRAAALAARSTSARSTRRPSGC